MPEFHQTGTGMKYYNLQLPMAIQELSKIAEELPKLTAVLERIADALEKSNTKQETEE